MEQTDYLTHFLDLAIQDLLNPADHVPVDKIEALLELVLRSPSTVSSTDPFKDCIGFEMIPSTLFEQLRRIYSVVGVDMKKHVQDVQSGQHFNIDVSLDQTGPSLNEKQIMTGLVILFFCIQFS